MSYDYSTLIATAARLIDRFGRDVTRTRLPASQTTNPVTGAVVCYNDEQEVIPCAPSTDTFRGINQRIPLALVDGVRVLATDRMLVLEAAAEPRMTDKFDGYNVEEIQEIRPANDSICWFVRVRA